ncbi:ATP-binding/permease protein CydD [Sporomusa rhizae]|uniref:thiol reductant ABC exporter subunit CydD n=1 Tax=Sporomusa rhizae TaxID=357999 RepID=UPI00352B24F9
MLQKELSREAGKKYGLLLMVTCLGVGSGIFAIAQAYYLTQVIASLFLSRQELAAVTTTLWLLGGIAVGRALVMYWEGVLAFTLAAAIKSGLRQRLLHHLLRQGPVSLAQYPAGELVNVLSEGIESLEAYFANYLPQLAKAVCIPVLILLAVGAIDLTSTAIMLVTAPLIPVFMVLIGKMAERRNTRQWEVLNSLSAHFLDVLSGLTTLKLFGRSLEQIAVIARVSKQFREATMDVLKVAFLSALALELLATISTALVAVTVGLRLVYGEITFTQAFFVLLLAPEYYLPLRMLGSQFHAGMSGKTAAAAIYRLFELTGGRASDGLIPMPPTRQLALEFRDVHAAYQQGKRIALSGISFVLDPGQHLAIVGPSGAGKSTVAALLLKFLEPAAGQILINGQRLQELKSDEWLRHVSYVPQRPHLFQGTVADNIGMACPDPRFEDIVAAAQAAGAHNFIMGLPRGYQTEIGEGGRELSGGQRQRLAIARAFLQDAPLVILDEAARGLDVNSQALLDEAFARLLAGRTAIIIAHRLTTVRQADKIMVLRDGRIMEAGTHIELLNAAGLYKDLVTASCGQGGVVC